MILGPGIVETKLINFFIFLQPGCSFFQWAEVAEVHMGSLDSTFAEMGKQREVWWYMDRLFCRKGCVW